MSDSLHDRNLAPALVAEIAREVIRRLKSGRDDGTEPTAGSTAERLVTLDTLDRYTNTSSIAITSDAVVTPAARDEAVRRGVELCVATAPLASANARSGGADAAGPTETQPLIDQLQRRGIAIPRGVELVWTEQPASEVLRRCQRGERAVMLTSFSDVDRFSAEIAPTTWVLDKHKLNLAAATNACARIAKLPFSLNGGAS